MEKELPIYLRTCADCGRPALTLNEQSTPLCAEHAAVLIPAENAPQDERGAEEAL